MQLCFFLKAMLQNKAQLMIVRFCLKKATLAGKFQDSCGICQVAWLQGFDGKKSRGPARFAVKLSRKVHILAHGFTIGSSMPSDLIWPGSVETHISMQSDMWKPLNLTI